jgi:hypothetical protein
MQLKILLFAAYEARATKKKIVDQSHIALGALRERRKHGDGNLADRIREHIQDTGAVDFPLGLSKAAESLLRLSHSTQDVIERYQRAW